MRVVLDTNCLIQSIPKRSPFRIVWESFLTGENTLCVSNEIIEEYIEILQKLTDEKTAALVVKTIIENPFVEFITPFYQFHLIHADPDDNKFVDCAIAATARYVVTNDHHFDILRLKNTFPMVDIINLTDFMELIRK